METMGKKTGFFFGGGRPLYILFAHMLSLFSIFSRSKSYSIYKFKRMELTFSSLYNFFFFSIIGQ